MRAGRTYCSARSCRISAISVLAPGEKLGAGRRFGPYRHSHLYVGRCLIRVRGAAEARTRVFVRIGREAIGDRSVGGGSSVRNELQLGNDALSGERGPHFRRRRALDGLTSPDAQGIESCQDRAAGRSEDSLLQNAVASGGPGNCKPRHHKLRSGPVSPPAPQDDRNPKYELRFRGRRR